MSFYHTRTQMGRVEGVDKLRSRGDRAEADDHSGLSTSIDFHEIVDVVRMGETGSTDVA